MLLFVLLFVFFDIMLFSFILLCIKLISIGIINKSKTNFQNLGGRTPSLISPSPLGLNNITTSGIRTADKVQYPIKMCCFTAHHSINLILSPNVSLGSIYE
jgi:hypothetical protein